MSARGARALVSMVAFLSACMTSQPFAPAQPKALHGGLRPAADSVHAPIDEAPFEDGVPPLSTTTPKPAPQILEGRTKNGIRVLGIARRDLPLVSFGVALKVAAPDDAVPGFADLVINSIRRSTKNNDADDVYGSFGQRAISWVTEEIGARGQLFTISAIKPLAFTGIGPTLDLFGESGLRTEDIENARDALVAGSSGGNRGPRTIARDVAMARLYPGWNVFRSADGSALSRTMTADVRAFATRALTADNIVVAVAGDLDWDRVLERVEDELGKLPHGGVAVRAPPPMQPSGTSLVPKQLAQTEVVVAFRSPGARSAEQPALAFARSAISWQLFRSLRLTHGVTYGSAVSSTAGLDESPVVIALSVEAGAVLTAIDGIFRAIDKARVLDNSDFARAKEIAQTQVYETLLTNEGAVSELARIGVLDQPTTWFADRASSFGSVTAGDIAAIMTKYFRRDAAQVVIVGDTGGLTKELEARQLGPVEVRSGQ